MTFNPTPVLSIFFVHQTFLVDCSMVFPVSCPGGWFEFARCTQLTILLAAEVDSGGHSSESPFACGRLFPVSPGGDASRSIACGRHVLAPREAEAWLHGGADSCVVWVTTLDVVKHFRSVSGTFSRVVPNRTSHDEGRLHMPYRHVHCLVVVA